MERKAQHSTLQLSLKQSAVVEYQCFAQNPDGTRVPFGKKRRNLILDSGLNFLQSFSGNSWVSVFTSAAIGTNAGNLPTSRASGVITFTQSTNTVTASAGFFTSGDVGRLLKYGTGTGGTEQYITGFTSSTSVTVSSSATVSAIVGTVWYVNETALDTETQRTSSYSTAAGECGSSTSGQVITHKRTFLFPAVVSGVTIKEVGWSPIGTAGGTLFGRDVITPGDTLIAGQQYVIACSIIITFSGNGAVSNVGTGLNTAGNLAYETIYCDAAGAPGLMTNAAVTASGTATAQGPLDTIASKINMKFAQANYTQNSVPDNSGVGVIPSTLSAAATCTASAYTSGSFTQVFTSSTYPVNTYAGNIYGLALVHDGGTAINPNIFVMDVKFTTPQPMLNSQTFNFAFRQTWGRTLTN